MKFAQWEKKLHKALSVEFPKPGRGLWVAPTPKARFGEVIRLINTQYAKGHRKFNWKREPTC